MVARGCTYNVSRRVDTRCQPYQPSLIAENAVASHKSIIADSLTKDFDLQCVYENFLCFPVLGEHVGNN